MSRAHFTTMSTFNLQDLATFVSKLKLNMDLWELTASQLEIDTTVNGHERLFLNSLTHASKLKKIWQWEGPVVVEVKH